MTRLLAALLLPLAAACVSGRDLPPAREAPVELFNGADLSGWHADVPALDEDPGGVHDLVGTDGFEPPEFVSELVRGRATPPPRVFRRPDSQPLSEETLERLRALGYGGQ